MSPSPKRQPTLFAASRMDTDSMPSMKRQVVPSKTEVDVPKIRKPKPTNGESSILFYFTGDYRFCDQGCEFGRKAYLLHHFIRCLACSLLIAIFLFIRAFFFRLFYIESMQIWCPVTRIVMATIIRIVIIIIFVIIIAASNPGLQRGPFFLGLLIISRIIFIIATIVLIVIISMKIIHQLAQIRHTQRQRQQQHHQQQQEDQQQQVTML